jgi:hypothetical protein
VFVWLLLGRSQVISSPKKFGFLVGCNGTFSHLWIGFTWWGTCPVWFVLAWLGLIDLLVPFPSSACLPVLSRKTNGLVYGWLAGWWVGWWDSCFGAIAACSVESGLNYSGWR